MAPPSAHADAVTARIEGVVALDLEVTSTAEVDPGLLEVRLEGSLDGFDPAAGQDVMVAVADPRGRPRWRRYTVRRSDTAAGTVELWVTTSTGGPGATWALGAVSGDRVEAVGPRGKVHLDATAATHLFVVDASGLAAMCAMVEAIDGPAGAELFVLTEHVVANRAILPVRDAPGATRSTVVAQDPASPADPTGLLDAVRAALDPTAPSRDATSRSGSEANAGVVSFDASRAAAYVFGELSLTRRAAALFGTLGLDPSRVHTKPYWRAGMANQDHGEPDKSTP